MMIGMFIIDCFRRSFGDTWDCEMRDDYQGIYMDIFM